MSDRIRSNVISSSSSSSGSQEEEIPSPDQLESDYTSIQWTVVMVIIFGLLHHPYFFVLIVLVLLQLLHHFYQHHCRLQSSSSSSSNSSQEEETPSQDQLESKFRMIQWTVVMVIIFGLLHLPYVFALIVLVLLYLLHHFHQHCRLLKRTLLCSMTTTMPQQPPQQHGASSDGSVGGEEENAVTTNDDVALVLTGAIQNALVLTNIKEYVEQRRLWVSQRTNDANKPMKSSEYYHNLRSASFFILTLLSEYNVSPSDERSFWHLCYADVVQILSGKEGIDVFDQEFPFYTFVVSKMFDTYYKKNVFMTDQGATQEEINLINPMGVELPPVETNLRRDLLLALYVDETRL